MSFVSRLFGKCVTEKSQADLQLEFLQRMAENGRKGFKALVEDIDVCTESLRLNGWDIEKALENYDKLSEDANEPSNEPV